MTVARLTPSDLRHDDPFVRALIARFAAFRASSGGSLAEVRGYLAGGLAVRCYTGDRVTGDIDMFFPGARVLIPPHTSVEVSAGGRAYTLLFDHQYTPEFGLLHPDYPDRAVELPADGDGFWISVLHPVDLAITKVARLQDHDRADIAALARLEAFAVEDFTRAAEEALAYAVGDLRFVRLNLRDAAEIVAAGARC